VREIAEAVRNKDFLREGISYFAQRIGFKKAFCKMLSPEQKYVRAQTSAECLEVFQRNPTDFKRRFVTMDETWIYHYIPEIKTVETVDWTR
jgi:hypothetical protein